MIIFILGKPNSGKGTQAMKIEEKYHMEHIDSGKYLRSWVSSNDNYITKKISQDLNTGKFVPISVVVNLWMEKLLSLKEHNNILFEGSPRKLIEGELMLEYFSWIGERPMVIYIDIPDEEIRRRSAIRSYCPKCNRTYSKVLDGEVSVCQDDQTPLQIREDDKPEVIENRIKVFHEEAEPTINFFKEKGLLHTIDGVGSVEEVFARIDNVIQELTKNIYDNN